MSSKKNRIICNLITIFVAFWACILFVALCCFLTKCQEYIKNRKNHEYKKILIKNSTLKKMFSKKMLRKKMKKAEKIFWF